MLPKLLAVVAAAAAGQQKKVLCTQLHREIENRREKSRAEAGVGIDGRSQRRRLLLSSSVRGRRAAMTDGRTKQKMRPSVNAWLRCLTPDG